MTTQAMASPDRGVALPPDGDDASAHAVETAFRVRFLVRIGVTIVCGAAVAGAVVYAILAEDLGSYAQSYAIISRTQKLVIGASALSGLIQIVLVGVPVMLLALLASHSIVGPLARLAGCFRRAAQGELPGTVRFRRGDQVGRIEAQFNAVSEAIAARHEEIGRQLDSLRAAEREMRGALEGTDDPEKRLAAVALFRARADELARKIAAIAGGSAG